MQVLDFLEAIPDASAIAPVYLFAPGKANPRARAATFESFLADQAVDRFIDQYVDPSSRDFAYAAYYADETNPGAIVLDAQTLPFLAERRVILVRNAERYGTESAAGPLLEYLKSPNDMTVILFIAAKADKRTKFYKACAKVGEIIECPALAHREMTSWVTSEARRREVQIDSQAAQEIAHRAGAHLSDADNALTLVVNFVGQDSERITVEHVIAACADVAEEEIWALTDAIADSQTGKALQALRRLTDLGKHPDEMIGTINWLLKNAYAVAMSEGEPPISRFVAQKVRPLAEKLRVTKLRAAFALCTDTQFMMRNGHVDSDLAIELLVVKLAAPIARRRSA